MEGGRTDGDIDSWSIYLFVEFKQRQLITSI